MKKYIILIPVYNDWKSVFKLLENIDLQIAEWDADVSVLIVNDASTFAYGNLGIVEASWDTVLSFKNIKSVKTITIMYIILILVSV